MSNKRYAGLSALAVGLLCIVLAAVVQGVGGSGLILAVAGLLVVMAGLFLAF
ncbi:hypothetical protein [Kineosporia succinea]|uniref:Uncharacterized protein (DUF58 family) n=1 Tax=Kineosporia succinea TaxID=84632 RepID=A0ABT9PBX8_9ACTN|nr:hypothetical protein [Kineosporia succinea]MDP9830212.1 uncharacterized protein (DUF58 family) [Kineosporia succinea]